MSTPNAGIPYVPEGTLDPAAGLNLALNIIDALLQTRVISMALTAPPGSPVDGARYIPASPATGAWAGLEGWLVRYVEEGDLWQSFEPGVQVHLILNLDDGGFYKFIPGSPGNWTLAAGLSDAPNDGQQYLRQSGTWAAIAGTLDIESSDSPPVQVPSVTQLVIDPDLLDLSQLGPNTALLAARRQYAPVLTTGDSNTNAVAGGAGWYYRFTNATATFTFNPSAGFVVGSEFHGRNAGVGTLTITASGGMTINAPAGGTLVIPPGGTFTVKIVGASEADLIGVTT